MSLGQIGFVSHGSEDHDSDLTLSRLLKCDCDFTAVYCFQRQVGRTRSQSIGRPEAWVQAGKTTNYTRTNGP
jgi:hypothetical protein